MKRSPLSTAIALAVLPTIANAQMLEEVIVTAQKKVETLVEAPVAVTLVSGETISDLSIFQADELNKLVTGMEVRFEGDSRVGVGLRGVGTFQQQSAPARVGVYMDDYYMASQAAFALGSMYDMANVQILKGPQGTLYGQPSPTGAMILSTRDPNFDGINGYVQGSYLADPEGYNLQGALNIPVIDDVLAFRVAGLSDDRETGLENVNPVNRLDEERNRTGVRLKALWNATDDLQVKLGYSYMETDDSEIYRAVETIKEGRPGFDPDANFKGIEADDFAAIADNKSEVATREENFYTLHVDWQVGDINVSWFSGALDNELDLVQDNDRTDIPSTVLAQTSEYGDDFASYQHELRISGEAFDFWEWTVGGYYQEAESQTDVVTSANRPENGGVFDIIIDIPLESETKALFTHNTFFLTENTDLTVGVRYNEFDQSDGTILTGNFLLGSEILPGGEVTDPASVFENVFPRPDCTVLNGTGSPPCLVGAGDFGWEEWTGGDRSIST
ncbi:MAG: TonB-dependent receptor plug domain-containing protein [Halioglobus sp.]